MNQSDIVFSPSEVASLGQKYLEYRRDHKSSSLPFPSLKFPEVYPMFPGELMSIIARPGHAKCLAKGTKVRMFDGTLKQVENVLTGDRILGADSTPRTVLAVAKGVEQMYWIRQNYGQDYRVNESHILSVKRSKNENGKKHGEILNIPVKDAVAMGDNFTKRWKGYKAGVEYKEKQIPVDPYFLGLWLGDGASKSSAIYTVDKEVVLWLRKYAVATDSVLSVGDVKRACQSYSIVKKKKGKNNNSVQSRLYKLGVLHNKHIPDEYMYTSRLVRLSLLAGLIDSDGHMTESGTYYITQKNEFLARQIKELCDSLGLRTSKSVMKRIAKCQTGTKTEVWQVSFNGDLSGCPILLERKRHKSPNFMDMTMTGISIEKDTVDEYFGFTLDGDGLFLLEDYTVTHNTGLMMYWARKRADWLRVNEPNRMSIYATWEQSVEELHTFYIAADQHLSVTKMAKAELTTDDWTKAITASAKRVSEPLWFIGHSVMRRTGRATIGVDLLAEAISKVIDMGFDVDSLFADYLQRMALPKGMDNPVIGYSRTLDDLKNLALGFGIPVIVGVQASRDVEDTSKGKDKLPIPEINHGQWTSNVEQSSDRVLSLVRPRRYRKEGEMFGDMKVVGHNQLLISVLKQKLGEGNFSRWVSFNPVFNQLDEKELQYGGV